MTTPGNPDFAVGMAVELRQVRRGAIGRPATAHVGHAVPLSDVREGDQASRAVCGTLTTVDDPNRRYRPQRTLDYMTCSTCAHHVTRVR